MKSPSSSKRIVLDATHRPRLRDALRASLFGYGSASWMSPRRRRVVQSALLVAGLVAGVALARLDDLLPTDALGAEEWILLVIAVGGPLALYLVLDVVMGLEMLEKRAVQSDLDLAHQIQRRMLPDRLPEIDGWEFAVFHESARNVGGDAYDVRGLDDGRVLVAITDVAGKGAAAAILSSGVLARLRALARTGMDVDEVVVRLSSALVEETEPEHFATLVIAEIDPRTGEVVYVNAGNSPPLIVRRDGSVDTLPSGGMPVGMLAEAEYEENRVTLEPGDRLVLATDGLFDADELGNTLVSEDELRDRMCATRERALSDVVESLAREVRARSGERLFDDVTVLVIGRR